MAEVMEFKVTMHCEGCAGSVRRGLKRIPGVQSYTVDYAQQKATVVGTADPEEIMSQIRKSGKTVSLISRSPAPAVEVSQESEVKSKEIKPFFSFRQRMPKMSGLKMPSLQKRMSTLKMQDLHKKMPNICDRLPRNAVTNACREFMSKGVFYAASHDISDSELESLKGNT
jgi:copper chaperone